MLDMIERLIFVSCGQQTPEEKDIGTSVKQLIDSKPGYKAYFAEYVQSLDSLEGFQACPLVLQFTDTYYYAVGRLEILT